MPMTKANGTMHFKCFQFATRAGVGAQWGEGPQGYSGGTVRARGMPTTMQTQTKAEHKPAQAAGRDELNVN